MKKRENPARKGTFELFVALAAVLFFAVTAVSQIFLRTPSRSALTSIEKYENIMYASNTALRKADIVISVSGGKPSEDIEIRFNGERTDTLDKKEKCVTVSCDGIIEIYNPSGQKVTVSAKTDSDNISFLMNKTCNVKKGIAPLCTVRFKD